MSQYPNVEINYILIQISHQAIALAMMIEKECGIVENPQFPSLWNPVNNSGSIAQLVTTIVNSEQLVIHVYLQFSNRYRHKVTGICQSNPVPVYGGILADVSFPNVARGCY